MRAFANAMTEVTKPTSLLKRRYILSTSTTATVEARAHQTSGMASSDSFKLTLGTYSIAFVGTALAMPLQQRFDRKTIWMAGICCMLPVMLAVGIMACMTQTKALQWAQGCILLVW
jgi:hypothetical protein